MRDRLIELLLSKSCMTNECPDVDCEKCECIAVHTGDAGKIADYLLENGVIVPPCKVGTTIYMIVTKRAKVTREYFHFIKKTKLTFLNLERVLENWGKTVFLTREEAISKLQASYEQVKEGAEE